MYCQKNKHVAIHLIVTICVALLIQGGEETTIYKTQKQANKCLLT